MNAASGPASRRAATLGIRTRLLGLILIPSLGLLAVGVQTIREDARLARDAASLAVEVDEAATALDALVSTTLEHRHSASLGLASSLGIPIDDTRVLVGYDVTKELAAARRAVDANPSVPRLVRAVGPADALARARRALDSGAAEDAVFVDLILEARQLWQSELAEVAALGVDAPNRRELRQAVDALRAVADLYEVGDERLLIAANIAVPGSAEGLAPSEGLGAVQRLYDEAVNDVEALADEHLAPLATPILADRPFENALAQIDGTSLDMPALAAAFRLGLEHDSQLRDLAKAAADDAESHALAVASDARSSYQRTVALLAVLVAVSIGLALAVAASIATPLRRLARRAAQISAGDLHGDPLTPGGPRESAVLATTLNEVVLNLRAVEDRLAALAAGNLEGARNPPPGRLGDLVGRSVDGLARTIDARQSLQRRLAHDAAHDALTGLANRRTAMRQLGRMLDSGSVGLLFIDLDGFKVVNDQFGHAVGDRVLVMAAQRLVGAASEDMLVARLGGDEFVVAVQTTCAHELVTVGRRVIDAMDDPIVVDGVPRHVGASIGVALARPSDDADHLLRSADHALYAAKRMGRGRLVLLDADLRKEFDEQDRIDVELREAIAADALELHYQPIHRTGGGMHGVEALVRWRLHDGTFLQPDAFIPVAERTGSVIELDRWVLRRAVEQLASWQDSPFSGLHVSVNVSAPSLLSTTFVGEMREALRLSGAPAGSVVVEVTETALLDNLETAAEHITELRAMGVRTTIDDFGTGYTSVSHLRHLPVSGVKIDRSFVHAMATDHRDHVLVDLITSIATVLGLDVVAEGVETQEQLDAVHQLGCHFAQGFLLGRPVPPDQLTLPSAALADALAHRG